MVPYATPFASGIQISSSVRFIKTNLQNAAVTTNVRTAYSISCGGILISSLDVAASHQFGPSRNSGNLSGSDAYDYSDVLTGTVSRGVGVYTASTTAFLDSLGVYDSRNFTVIYPH